MSEVTLDDMVKAIRSFSTRERAAKAVSLENEALQMERRAGAMSGADAAELLQTASRLREVAEAIRPPWGPE